MYLCEYSISLCWVRDTYAFATADTVFNAYVILKSMLRFSSLHNSSV